MRDVVGVPGLVPRDSRTVDAPDSAAETAYVDIREAILAARQRTKATINSETVHAYWQIGRRIVETPGERADYGKRLPLYLSQRLTREFGPGFDETNLRKMRQLYLAFPIQDTLRLELSWSHCLGLDKSAERER